MNETQRFEDGTRFIGREDGFDLHVSNLPQTSELDQDWLEAARDAMRAASSVEKKHVPTPGEIKAGQIATTSVRQLKMRTDEVALVNVRMAG